MVMAVAALWVMMRAPLPEFLRSPRHMDYIARAWRNPELSPYLYMDPFAGQPAPGDLLCFLRADDQGRGTAGLQSGLSGSAPLPAYSHCDIVVAANVGGDRTLYLVGGNVLNTVMMRKLPLDASGRLLPGPTPLVPRLELQLADSLNSQTREAVRRRVARWLDAHLASFTLPLRRLQAAGLDGAGRGLCFLLVEGLGNVRTADAGALLKTLSPADRARLSRLGVRFGLPRAVAGADRHGRSPRAGPQRRALQSLA